MARNREMVEVAAVVAFVLVGLVLVFPNFFSALFLPNTEDLTEAMYYTKLEDNKVQCQLCFRKCTIPSGQRGFCRNRQNIRGTLYSMVYGKLCALQIDPIEKEPLFHVLPSSAIVGVATAGCNFRCSFCQNWQMSHERPEDVQSVLCPPETVVNETARLNCTGVHFTYTEPTVFYEYMLDVAKAAQEYDLHVGVHTNGAMNPEPLRELLQYVDAVSVDLKSFEDEFYDYVTEQSTSGPFQPDSPPRETVLNTLKTIKAEGVWLEVVNLVIPTLNDDMESIRDMCTWIKDNLGEDTPIHFLRFFPAHKLTKLPSTPVETLEEARRIALDVGLKFVYIDNVPGHEGNSSFCPECGEPIIVRYHFSVLVNTLDDGKCRSCGCEIPGIWSQ